MEEKRRVEMGIGPITVPMGRNGVVLVSGGSSPDFLHAVYSFLFTRQSVVSSCLGSPVGLILKADKPRLLYRLILDLIY